MYVTAFAVYFLFFEIVLRLFFLGFNAGFFTPYKSLLTKHYPELLPIFDQEVKQDDNAKKILILGGSVVSTNWSHLETRLETLLRPYSPDKSAIRVFNAAAPANSSLDNLIKYKLLADYNFDLVLYYEAINENRFNNVPANLFKEDYSHVEWYRDIYMILQHPDLKYTILPYTLHYIYRRVNELITKPASLNMNGVHEKDMVYGSEIKTSSPYRKNIQELINLANSRNQQLLLMSYAPFFPEGVQLTGSETDEKYFGGCKFRSSILIWGDITNVKKGIAAHNKELRELVASNKVNFLDMDQAMIRRKDYYCDICHLREETGAQYFASIIKDHIVAKQLLWQDNQRYATVK
ncbi:hypothetical protein GCM10027291_49920 [Telluribacter humicola]